MKNKRAGILTFHSGDNYGAVLQAYALRKKIQKLGVPTDVINYNPGRKNPWYTDDELQEKYLGRLEAFRLFLEECVEVEEPPFYSVDDERMKRYTHYITGSDQVWNTSFPYVNSTYFLAFAEENARRISYAASVGLSPDNPRLKKELFEQYISKMDYLSVRERVHEEFIAQYTDKKVTTVIDPSMLLTAEEYDELLPEKKEEPFIFVYFLKHDLTAPLTMSFVNMLSRKTGLKVIHSFVEMPPQALKNEERTMFYEGPREFLWYIKNAEYVVTNSFHGTVFSLLYHKPFYTYIVKSMASRITNLLSSVKLEDRIIRGYKNICDVTKYVDFTAADEYIKSGRLYAEQYLKNALEIEE